MALTSNASSRASELADQAARAAGSAYDSVSNRLNEVREQAGPTLSRLSGDAETMARRGMDVMLDTSEQLRERALRATDTTVDFIKDEPFKAILIAAAAGATLMALIALMSRPRD